MQYVTTFGTKDLDALQTDAGTKDLAEHVSQYITKQSALDENWTNQLKEHSSRIIQHHAEINKLKKNGTGKAITIKVETNGAEVKQIEGKHYHPAFEKVLKETQTLKQVWLCGEAGTGKTTLAEHVAEAMNLKFAYISCSAGMSEAHILGRMNIQGEYLPAPFIDVYENGGLMLFDEVDNSDANVLTVLNSALANGKISIPNRVQAPFADRHKDCHIILSSNTWGKGYEGGSDAIYVREMLDGAFRDRFAVAKTHVGYDKNLEAMFCSDYPELAEELWRLRKKVKDNRLEYVISTRCFKDGAKLMKALDYTVKDVIGNLTIDWTEEEQKKVRI